MDLIMKNIADMDTLMDFLATLPGLQCTQMPRNSSIVQEFWVLSTDSEDNKSVVSIIMI